MMESNALECAICCNVFSQENCPRNLPCSHKFCGPCIDGIIATQKKTCPNCREEFTATSSDDLDVVKQLSTTKVKPKTLSKGPMGSFVEWKKLTKEILDEMKDVFAANETLKEMKNGVLDTKKEIESFIIMLRDIELSTKQILEKINTSSDQLDTASDFTLTNPSQDAQEKVKKINELLHKTQRERDDITKEIILMKREIRKVAEEIEKETRVAVKVIEGKQMVAPVGVNPTKQVCWSHFEEGQLLPEGLSIKHKALMNTPSRRAFLDLAVGGRIVARLVIKVKDESNLALNFLHLCAGDLGPSYANSHLSSVESKGKGGECICLNGYQTSGNTTSIGVLQVDWNKEKKRDIYKPTPFKMGEVRGYFSDGEASKFYIVTRDYSSWIYNWNYNNCFGIVEEGLDTLRDAITRYPDITAVRIADCGLISSV